MQQIVGVLLYVHGKQRIKPVGERGILILSCHYAKTARSCGKKCISRTEYRHSGGFQSCTEAGKVPPFPYYCRSELSGGEVFSACRGCEHIKVKSVIVNAPGVVADGSAGGSR